MKKNKSVSVYSSGKSTIPSNTPDSEEQNWLVPWGSIWKVNNRPVTPQIQKGRTGCTMETEGLLTS